MKVFILILILFNFSAFSKEKIRLTTGEWAPYISQSSAHYGLFSQITREAFDSQGVEVEFGFFPWQRVFQLSRDGEWDGTIAYAKTALREQIYYYSEPIYSGKYVFFNLKTHPFKWKSFEDLKGIKIGATRGFGGMGQDFITAEEKKIIDVERLADDTLSFNMLLLNRVQAVASDLDVGYALINKIFDEKNRNLFTHNEKHIQHAKYHLVMPKSLLKSERLIKKFNLGLALLKKTGRYNVLINEFNAKNILHRKPKKKVTYLSIAE